MARCHASLERARVAARPRARAQPSQRPSRCQHRHPPRTASRRGAAARHQAEFEQVLHPIFQEDELTLILVGGVLGLIVGYLQAIFTQPDRDPGDDVPPQTAPGPA